MIKRVLALASLSLLAVGCSSSDGIGDKIDDLESVVTAQVDVICDCFAEMQYADKTECVNDYFEPLTATERTCVIDAYELDETGSKDYLDCLLGAEDIYLACVNTNIVCTDGTSIDTCNSDYTTNVQMCMLPAAVLEAGQACFPQ